MSSSDRSVFAQPLLEACLDRTVPHPALPGRLPPLFLPVRQLLFDGRESFVSPQFGLIRAFSPEDKPLLRRILEVR